MSSLGLCAEIQLDFARLKIFMHSQIDPAALERSMAESGASLYNNAYKRLRPVVMDGTWLYPELLKSMAALLVDFPISTILERSGYDYVGAQSMSNFFTGFADSLNDVAEELDEQKVTSTLLALARYIRRIVGRGAGRDEPIYGEVARLIPGQDEQVELQRELIGWAERTHRSLNVSATRLLADLINDCPRLKPAHAILIDLIERMDTTVYIPLVFNGLGVAVPVKIEANYSRAAQAPQFYVLGEESREMPSWLHVEPEFTDAIRRGRTRTFNLLAGRGYKPESPEFKTVIGLPDLRIAGSEVVYDQGSIELPVAIALFCQHPRLLSSISLNPEIMLTGPISAEALTPKHEALGMVGAATELLVSAQERLELNGKRNVWIVSPDRPDATLQRFLTEQHWNDFRAMHPKILTFGTEQPWNQPILVCERRKRPLVPIRRHQIALSDLMQKERTVQLFGLTCIGKTWLLAQWLQSEDVQSRYELILYTCVPEFPPDKPGLMSEWARGALEELARRLDRSWDRPAFASMLNQNPTLLANASELADGLQETLSNCRLLWVIDNGQSLLNEDFILEEARFSAILAAISGKWDKCDLLFVTNRELVKPYDFRPYHLTEGFNSYEAINYLDEAEWRFPDLRSEVAKTLGSYPGALAILVGYAAERAVRPAEITEIMESLPSAEGETRLRERVGEKILEHVLRFIKDRYPGAWWTLLTASTFIEGFRLLQLKHLARIIPEDVDVSLKRDSSTLERCSLLNFDEFQCSMHSLVRGYAQDQFRVQFQKHYREAHRRAGETYFPLRQNGQPFFRPTEKMRAKYTDPKSCGTALYHYEMGEHDAGRRAVLLNYYEREIPRAQWWMEYGNRRDYRTYGFFRAEKLLRDVLQGLGAAQQDDPDALAKMAPWDINCLMAKALHRQQNPTKYEEAALHYRQAIEKGARESIPLLISLLCDMSDGQPITDPNWLEAETLFTEVSNDLARPSASNKKSTRYDCLGEAYEKVARRYLALYPNDSALAFLVIDEATNLKIGWDGIYLLAAELANADGQTKEVERWLTKGLQVCPRSGELWKRYYLLKAKAGELESLRRNLRFVPRGVNAVVSLSQSLIDQGFFEAAKECVEDALKIEIYENSGNLWFQRAKIQEKLDDVGGAISSYDQAIKSNSRMGEAYVAKGKLYEHVGKLTEAEKVYEGAIVAGVTQMQVLIAYGKLCEAQGNFVKAEELYIKATNENSAEGSGWVALAELCGRLGKINETEKVYEGAIAAGVKHTPVLIAYGKLCEAQGNFIKAEELYGQATTANDSSPHGSVALGQLYEHVAENAQSEQIKTEVLKKAVAAYQDAIGRTPTDGTSYVLLGRLREALGDTEGALVTYELGARQAWEDNQCSIVLGQFFEARGILAKAGELYRRRLRAGAINEYFYYLLVRVQLAQCDFKGARETADEAMTRPRPGTWSRCALAEVHLRTNDLSEAGVICRKAIQECGPENRLYELLLEAMERQGNVDGAIAENRNWVDSIPSNGDAHVALASRLVKKGEMEEARQTVQKGLSIVPDWPALLELATQLKMK